MDKVLIFVPLSRENRRQEVVNHINELDTKGLRVHVLFIVDNRNIKQFKTKYYTIYRNTGNAPASGINVGMRRQRITNSFNKAKEFMQDRFDYVFVFEDDSQIYPDTLQKLIKLHKKKSEKYDVGFVSGVQVGRWGYRMLGVWKLEGDKIKTLPKMKGVQEVDACGFYCYLTTPELFRMFDYRFGQLGPDVYWGLDLRSKDYKNYADFNQCIPHKVDRGILTIENSDIIELSYKT